MYTKNQPNETETCCVLIRAWNVYWKATPLYMVFIRFSSSMLTNERRVFRVVCHWCEPCTGIYMSDRHSERLIEVYNKESEAIE